MTWRRELAEMVTDDRLSGAVANRFIDIVETAVAEEREACAKLAEALAHENRAGRPDNPFPESWQGAATALAEVAGYIRARGDGGGA